MMKDLSEVLNLLIKTTKWTCIMISERSDFYYLFLIRENEEVRNTYDRHEVVPGRGRNHNYFWKDVWSIKGSETSNHTSHWVSNVNARSDLKLIQDGDKIVGITMERRISREAEVFRIRCASTHVVKQDHSVVVDEVGKHMYPDWLIGTKAMTKNDQLLAIANHTDIVSLQKCRCRAHDLIPNLFFTELLPAQNNQTLWT